MSSEVQSGHDALLGKVLGGKYRVERLLARGGMGRVYRGVQQPLERPVAIKVLDLNALDEARNEQVEKRFFLEASVCAKLTHPNTLTIHDYGTLEGARGVFIVMEFLEGMSLRERLKQVRALPVGVCLHVARQICAALIEAHEAGLVHRDLKPGNVVLLDRHGDPNFVKVVDFGLVKQVGALDDSAEVLTAEGLFLGTPRYMAPEQISGDDVDARTDIYALGVLLYEALAGRPPFRSKVRGNVPVDLFNAHLKKRPPPFAEHELSAGVPADVEAIVMRCLEKEPGRRFASMREVLAALDAVGRDLDEAPTRIESMAKAASRAVSIADTLLDGAPSDQTTAATKDLGPRPVEEAPRRFPWAAALSALVLLGVLGTIAALALLRGAPEAEAEVLIKQAVTTPTEPAPTDAQTTDPKAADSKVAVPKTADPKVADPNAAQAQATEEPATASSRDTEPTASKRPTKRPKRPRRPAPRDDLDIKVDR